MQISAIKGGGRPNGKSHFKFPYFALNIPLIAYQAGKDALRTLA